MDSCANMKKKSISIKGKKKEEELKKAPYIEHYVYNDGQAQLMYKVDIMKRWVPTSFSQRGLVDLAKLFVLRFVDEYV